MTGRRYHRYKMHTAARALEHYGVRLQLVDVDGLNQVARLGLGRVFKHDGHDLKMFVTALCGTELPVVFKVTKQAIVTVMPPWAPDVVAAKAARPT